MNKSLIFLFFFAYFSSAIRFNFDIKGDSQRCFKENLQGNTHVVGEASISSSLVPNFRLLITDNKRYVIFDKKLDPESFGRELNELKKAKRNTEGLNDLTDSQLEELVYGEHRETLCKIRFAFSTQADGVVQMCLYNMDSFNNSYDFEFNHGIDARDYSNIAKKQNLKPAETDILKVEDFVKEMKSTAENIWVKESHKLEMSESFNTSLIWASLFGIFVIIAFGFFEYWVIRNYFRQKKLI